MPVQSKISRKPRQQPRATRACERCRLKKYKCDEAFPCHHCEKSRFECIYQGTKRQLEQGVSTTKYSVDYIRSQESHIRDLTLRLLATEEALRVSTQQQSHLHVISNDTQESLLAAPAEWNTSARNSMFNSNESPAANLDNSTGLDVNQEITDMNQYTKTIEYHGGSSSVAILDQVQRKCGDLQNPFSLDTDIMRSYSLVSALHNPGFCPQPTAASQNNAFIVDHSSHQEEASVFIESYFDTIHCIHPIIDKDDFATRSKDLWINGSSSSSFMALYYSLLSLGALVRTWDEDHLLGMKQFEWSRKLFQQAQSHFDESKSSNDLDTIQGLFLMAKICQHELNSHLAYIYLGLCIRTALSAGLNRKSSSLVSTKTKTISNTWWAIYSLEIEMAFSLGRPDTLGLDIYHSCGGLDIDSTEQAIIPAMIPFSQIVRKVSVRIYSSRLNWQEKITDARVIQAELDEWIDCLPATIKPDTSIQGRLENLSLREPKWCRRQRLIIRLRYYNIKALLFCPFLSKIVDCSILPAPEIVDAVRKCTGAARKTIEIIHETFRVHDFFRTWWYNTTYIVFAASVLLLQIVKFRSANPAGWWEANIKVVEMAVELLEAMDESEVAKRASEIIKRFLSAVKSPVVPSNGAESSMSFNNSPFDSFVPPNFDQLQELTNTTPLSGLIFHDILVRDMAEAFCHSSHNT